MTQEITASKYKSLLARVRLIMQKGLVNAKVAIEHARVVTYWNIGTAVVAAIEEQGLKKHYKEQLLQRLGVDLNISYDLLTRLVHFSKTYSKLPEEQRLTWTHYQCLIRISDDAKRRKLERRIVRENLSSTALKVIVSDLNAQPIKEDKGPAQKLVCKRGLPFLYRVSQINHIHAKSSDVEIDLGFSINISKPVGTEIKLQRGVLVRSHKTEQGYQCVASTVAREKLYTYMAIVERVVDGDTLILKIDCGFGVRIRHRVRLRGIDTPELKTVKGDKAQAFLQDYLKDTSFVIVKTYGAEKFGRYLVDVFALPESQDSQQIAEQGVFVNQLLLDQGWAQLYQS